MSRVCWQPACSPFAACRPGLAAFAWCIPTLLVLPRRHAALAAPRPYGPPPPPIAHGVRVPTIMHLPAWPALQKDRMRHLFTQVRSRQQGPPPRPRAQPRRGPRTAVQAGTALPCWGRADCCHGALICPPVKRHTCPLSLAGGARRDLQHHMNDAEQHRMTNAHDQSATLLRPDTTRPLPAGLPLGVPVLGCGAAPAGLAGVSAALPCCDCASDWPLPEEGAALPLFGINHSPQARVLLQDPVEVLRSTPRLHGRPHVARSAFGAQGAAWPCRPHALPGADQTPDPTDVISGACTPPHPPLAAPACPAVLPAAHPDRRSRSIL